MERVDSEEGFADGAERFAVRVVGELVEDSEEEVVGEERENWRGLHWELWERVGVFCKNYYFLGGDEQEVEQVKVETQR